MTPYVWVRDGTPLFLPQRPKLAPLFAGCSCALHGHSSIVSVLRFLAPSLNATGNA